MSSGTRGPTPFDPVWVGELELARPISAIAVPRRDDGEHYRRAQILVRLHRHPLGFLEVDVRGGELSVEDLLCAVSERLGSRVAAHLTQDGLRSTTLQAEGLPASDPLPCWSMAEHELAHELITVVISTRDRPESLGPCLETVLAIRDRFEVVVVDNAPRTNGTRQLVDGIADRRLRYTIEPQPGLSAARNRGVEEASGKLIAFTDDDVLVDSAWLAGIRLGFSRAREVGCVTGMVPAAELETWEQAAFESRVAWPRSCERRLFDLRANRLADPVYPYTAGSFGAGANFAVTREALRAVGRFDEALGAGSAARGGEDLDFFLRVILAGFRIAYEPAALVWHVHRRDRDTLRRQFYGYGSGLSAFATKQLLSPRTAPDVIRRVGPALARAGRATRAGGQGGIDRRLVAAEVAGLLVGPPAYVRGRIRTRRSRKRGR